MVVTSTDNIHDLLLEHFRLSGTYTIHNGVVDVTGDVTFSNNNLTQMPVNFGTVYGDFIIRNSGVTTLVGSPKIVTQRFTADNCSNLTTCLGAPEHVLGSFTIYKCPLENLQGFPTECSYAAVEYDEYLPVLRLLQVKGNVDFYVSDYDTNKEQASEDVMNILQDARWKGKGKQGMLNCALELKKHGFAGIAGW